MSEPFPRFSQNFRMLFSSILAICASGVIALINIAKNFGDKISCGGKWATVIGCSSFILTILVFILISFYGLSNDVVEGERSGQKQARDLNKEIYAITVCVAMPIFVVGLISFIISFILYIITL